MLILSLLSLAQAGCKLETKADPITGVSTATVDFGNPTRWKLVKTGDAVRMHSRFVHFAVVDEGLPAGFVWTLKLADDTILELVSEADALPNAMATAYGVQTEFYPVFPLTDAQLDQLAGSPIVFMRRSMFGEQADVDLGKKYQKRYQASFACMAEAD